MYYSMILASLHTTSTDDAETQTEETNEIKLLCSTPCCGSVAPDAAEPASLTAWHSCSADADQQTVDEASCSENKSTPATTKGQEMN